MNDYPCEDMRKLMEGESMKFPCEWVKENWSGGGDDDSFGKLIDRSIITAVIPDGVVNIGANAFYDCASLTSVTIPDSVINIRDYAFNNCTSLASVTIPSSVTSIGDNVFAWCTSLTSITIPSSVISIGNYAFAGWTNLQTINCGFAEGAVDGAPWGAPNATINYNVTA